MIGWDLMGPFQTQTPGQNRYCQLGVDRASGAAFINLLKTKDQALDGVKVITKRLETQRQRSVGAQLIDGGELHSHEMQSYCDDNGYALLVTCSHSASQLGLVERVNRTIGESGRTMMLAAGAPHCMWGEAFCYACWLYNRAPHTGLSKHTESFCTSLLSPYEGWHEVPADLSMAKTWGTKVYYRVMGHVRKLDPHARPGIFLGVSITSKGWRVLDLESRRVLVSRDVRFDESIYPWKLATAGPMPALVLPPSAAALASPPAAVDVPVAATRCARDRGGSCRTCSFCSAAQFSGVQAA